MTYARVRELVLTGLRSLFCEDTGKLSFGRIGSAVVIHFTLAWITFAVVKQGSLPDLSGAGVFLGSALGALYSANKISTAINNNNSNNQQQ